MSRRKTQSLARFLAATLLAASSWPSAAASVQPAAASRTPRFLIQSIEVRGARHVSSAVVLSESHLEAGRVYTEGELRDAVARINRLPFILDVDIAFEKGRERDTYVLLVDVRETRRFFYRVDLRQSYFGDPLTFETGDVSLDNRTLRTTAGARFFVGARTLAFAAAGSEGAQVGFTRYGLFGENVFLSLGTSREVCCTTTFTPLGLDPGFSSWIDGEDARRATLTVGVPLAGNHSVRGSVAVRESGRGFRRPAVGRIDFDDFLRYDRRTEEDVRLAWLFDTTDDPVFPRRGRAFVAAVDYRALEADLETDSGAPVAAMSSELLRFSVLARRHWPFARRHSFAAGASLALGSSRIENLPAGPRVVANESLHTWEASATIRHSMRLHEAKKARRFRQLYWRNSLEYSVADTSSELEGIFGTLEVATLSTELVYRNAWGLVSVGFRVVELGDVL